MTTEYEHFDGPDDGNDGISSTTWVAETFTTTSQHSVTSVKIYALRQSGYDPGTFTLSIRATDGNGHPTGGDLTSGSQNASGWSTSAQWHEQTVTEYMLSNGVKYAIVCRCSNANNAIYWRLTNAGGYSGGNRELSFNSGGSWSSYSQDELFQVWGNPPVSPPTVTTQAATGIATD